MRLWVSMGVRDRPDEPLRAALAEVDPATGSVRHTEVAIRGGPAGAHQELTGAEVAPDGTLLQAAHTEVLVLDPSTGEVMRRVTHPRFHGVHSAGPGRDGGLVVTCAGTDSVLELDRRGELVRHHYLGPGDYAARFGADTDVRLADHDALKPHAVHPNHAVWVGADL